MDIISKGHYPSIVINTYYLYLNNKNIDVKIGSNLYQDKIILIIIYKNNNINKLIFDPEYSLKEIMKYINIPNEI